jgi:hypothetical protein
VNASSVREASLASEREVAADGNAVAMVPIHKAGRHSRVRCTDLMAFKAASDRASGLAMEKLARQAQELRLGYK